VTRVTPLGSVIFLSAPQNAAIGLAAEASARQARSFGQDLLPFDELSELVGRIVRVTAVPGSIGRRSDPVRQVELDDEFDAVRHRHRNRTCPQPHRSRGSDLAARYQTTPEIMGPDVESALTALEDVGVLVRDP
jgi:hypothetical protein